MIRAWTIAILTLAVTPAFAQEPVRIGAVSMAYVARSSKAGQSALAEIERFVKVTASSGTAALRP